jgi:hypothetical protein
MVATSRLGTDPMIRIATDIGLVSLVGWAMRRLAPLYPGLAR